MTAGGDSAPAPPRHDGFARRVLVAVLVVTVVALLLALAWKGLTVLLVAFAGLLLAVLLLALTDLVRRWTGWGHGAALTVVLVTLLGILAAVGVLAAPSISRQVDQLGESLPRSLGQLRDWLGQTRWGGWLVAQTPRLEEGLDGGSGDMLTRATGIASATLGAVTNLLVFLFIGLFLAVEPSLYRRGVVRLVPPARRERAREVLATLGTTLRWWLVARFTSMAVILVLTWVGLAVLGVPLAFVLAVLAALLTFIPYVGPVLAALPPVLLALSDSPRTAVWVIALFLAIQLFESYLIEPLVERKAVRLPPALTITSQMLLALVAGPLGLLLASPLVAVAMVLVQMLYVEDALGDELDQVGAGH